MAWGKPTSFWEPWFQAEILMVALWGSFRECSWDLYGFVGFHHLHPALIDRAGSNVFASRPSLLRSFLLSPSHATPTGGCSHVVCHGTMLRSHEPKGGGTRFNQLAGFHHLCWGGPIIISGSQTGIHAGWGLAMLREGPPLWRPRTHGLAALGQTP